jgi:hypothetical protein
VLREIGQTATVQIVEDNDLSGCLGQQTIDKVAADKPRPTGHDHPVDALVHARQYC